MIPQKKVLSEEEARKAAAAALQLACKTLRNFIGGKDEVDRRLWFQAGQAYRRADFLSLLVLRKILVAVYNRLTHHILVGQRIDLKTVSTAYKAMSTLSSILSAKEEEGS